MRMGSSRSATGDPTIPANLSLHILPCREASASSANLSGRSDPWRQAPQRLQELL